MPPKATPRERTWSSPCSTTFGRVASLMRVGTFDVWWGEIVACAYPVRSARLRDAAGSTAIAQGRTRHTDAVAGH